MKPAPIWSVRKFWLPFAGLTESERKARYADIKSLLDDACAGEIDEPEDIKPIRRHPELWELRWDLGGTQLRMYHAEPPTAPGYLIALKFHVKQIVPADDAATRAAQNAEIDVAATRYIVGRPWMWGLL